jgi:hypothetical protein
MLDLSSTQLADLCAQAVPRPDHHALIDGLHQGTRFKDFRWVLSRGGWYRPGGLITSQGARVADDVTAWAQEAMEDSGGDIQSLIEHYISAEYWVTRWIGKTHFFVVETGNRARDFQQLEIEEIQEIRGRPFIDRAAPPEDFEELLDPAGAHSVDARPLSAPRYIFRRITDVSAFLEELARKHPRQVSVLRFLREWDESSARLAAHFCDHWVLNLRQERGPYGDRLLSATPVCTFPRTIPRLHVPALARGSDLARLVQEFDHQLGYPFAWYFCMVRSRHVPKSLGDTVYQDLRAGYDYLPDRDQRILVSWIRHPYGL